MVTKAIIPIAGKGTRLRPQTVAVPKPFLPLVDGEGGICPVIHHIVSEAVSAGISQVALIVSPDQLELARRYFETIIEEGQLQVEIEYLVQETPLGFGDAVSVGEGFAAGQPFLLMLGDHVHVGPGCAEQMREAFVSVRGAAVTGMQIVDSEMLHMVGAAAGDPVDGSVRGLYRCRKFVEKPDVDYAQRELVTAGLEKGTYLAHAGVYIFTSEIFECIRQVRQENVKGEIELAAAQELLLHEFPNDYYLLKIDARTLDVGTPAGYAETFEVVRGECQDG